MKTIGLDLGTSALKGVLFDGEKIVAEGAREVTFIRDGDMVEIAPQAHWADCLSLIRELAAASDEPVAAQKDVPPGKNFSTLSVGWTNGRRP